MHLDLALAPCPCCGFTEPRLSTTSALQLMASSITILDLVVCPANAGGCGMMSGWHISDIAAVEAWNQRASVVEKTQPKRDIEALVQELECLSENCVTTGHNQYATLVNRAIEALSQVAVVVETPAEKPLQLPQGMRKVPGQWVHFPLSAPDNFDAKAGFYITESRISKFHTEPFDTNTPVDLYAFWPNDN